MIANQKKMMWIRIKKNSNKQSKSYRFIKTATMSHWTFICKWKTLNLFICFMCLCCFCLSFQSPFFPLYLFGPFFGTKSLFNNNNDSRSSGSSSRSSTSKKSATENELWICMAVNWQWPIEYVVSAQLNKLTNCSTTIGLIKWHKYKGTHHVCCVLAQWKQKENEINTETRWPLTDKR